MSLGIKRRLERAWLKCYDLSAFSVADSAQNEILAFQTPVVCISTEGGFPGGCWTASCFFWRCWLSVLVPSSSPYAQCWLSCWTVKVGSSILPKVIILKLFGSGLQDGRVYWLRVQGVVSYMLPVEVFAAGIKRFDQLDRLIVPSKALDRYC